MTAEQNTATDLSLTPTQKRLLHVLNDGQWHSHAELVRAGWHFPADVLGPDEQHLLRVSISRLRKQLPEGCRIESSIDRRRGPAGNYRLVQRGTGAA